MREFSSWTELSDEELMSIIQRLKVIEELLKFNVQMTQSATREELERMKEQQKNLLLEMQTINTQLQAMERERVMQLSS